VRLRRLTATVAVAAFGLMAAACAPPAEENEGEGNQGNQESQGEGPVAGSSVTVGWNQPFYSYNDATSNGNATANANIKYLMNTGFNYYNTDQELVKDESFGTYEKTSDDPLTIKYTINDDVNWSDGTPVDAADLLLTWAAGSGNLNTVGADEVERDPDTNVPVEGQGVFFDTSSAGLPFVTQTPEIGDDGKSLTLVYDEPFADWEVEMAIGVPAHVTAGEALGIEDGQEAKDAFITAVQEKDEEALSKISAFWNSGYDYSSLPDNEKLYLSNGAYLLTDFTENQFMTLKANPDAVVLFVETDGDLGSNAAHEFVLRHPAVDILNTSYGIAIAGLLGVVPETRAFHETYEGVVQRGKLHFTSAGNNPGLDPLSGGAGPWWSIGVSGVEEDKPNLLDDGSSAQGHQLMSGNLADMVGDFTQQLPYCLGGKFDADGFEDPAGSVDCQHAITPNVPGTSFSSPRAAGVASRVLLEARRQMGHVGGIRVLPDRTVMAAADTKELDNWQLRRALEQGAWVPRATDYSPFGYVTWEVVSLPVNPVAPWLQVGWGELTANPDKGVVPGALAHLGFPGAPVAKAPGFCEYQTELIVQRKRYWDQVAPQIPFNYTSNDGVGGGTPTPDPFVYCASSSPTHPATNDTGGQAAADDADGDGVANAGDNCAGVPNAGQANGDGDASGDACDADDDNDLVADAGDNCPATANASQADADGDGLGDACDAGGRGRDRDGDGVGDKADNCPRHANPDQADADADGKGDACDKR